MPPEPIGPRLESLHTEKLFIGMVAGLIVGGGVGYFVGDMLGEARGAASVKIYTPTLEEPLADTKPLPTVKQNPLKDIKVNPFE